MDFNTYFRVSSYAMIGVAMLALAVAGGLHPGLVVFFAVLMVVAWKLEASRWQLSERAGLIVVLLSVPLFFVDWYIQKSLGEPPSRLGVNALAHLIIFLSAVKLLQVKSDRDWVFLYLISFFEVLLAAGLSVSPAFLGTLSLYLLCALSTIIAFEIRKATRSVKTTETRLLVPPDSKIFKRASRKKTRNTGDANRLPLTSLLLLCFIFVLALPLFFVAPRASSPLITRGSGGLSGFIGFSENVSLGDIGTLKRNDQVVMRVKLDDGVVEPSGALRWRGIALDEFTGRSWRKSAEARASKQQLSERGSFRIDGTDAPHRLLGQTVFLEPLDTSILFAAPRPVLIQGDFPFVRVDAEGSVQFRPHEVDRLIYRALSDPSEPAAEILRQDRRQYSAAYNRYLALPKIDPRISELTRDVIINAHARNRYDAARGIENYLKTNYGYSLDRKAAGQDPLADFLFDVREGHCEYFATSMAVMLRTVGVASRIVNGFLPGEYNEAADAFTVRQSDAHSWVEVYFPETNSWVTFDPTPPAGRGSLERTGMAAWFSKHAEALELIWFQYVIGYDRQEQRSLATSLHNRIFQYQHLLSQTIAELKTVSSWNAKNPLLALLAVCLMLGLVLLVVRCWRFGWSGLRLARKKNASGFSAVEFYERMVRLLAERGIIRASDQTPLEFAMQTGMDVPVRITQAYHRVRYGAEVLSSQEQREIDRWLIKMEQEKADI